MKPLVVGQAPSKTAGHRRAFDGDSGRRFAKLLGISLEQFLSECDTVNLLRSWPGKHGGAYAYRDKGDRFPIAAAKRGAVRVMRELDAVRNPILVLCGRRVARAFGVHGDFLQWGVMPSRGHGAVMFLTIPHPSGCNVWWHDARNRELAAAALESVLWKTCRRGKLLGLVA